MSHETTRGTVFPLIVKEVPHPDLVKKIGGTTLDVHIHFSETRLETFADKVVRLIQNDKKNETDQNEVFYSLFLIDNTRTVRYLLMCMTALAELFLKQRQKMEIQNRIPTNTL